MWSAPGRRQAALRRLLRACILKPIPRETLDIVWAFNLKVSPEMGGLLSQRELDFADVLEQLTVPVLVTHGRKDTVVLPAMGEYILDHCRSAQASWREDISHAPSIEAPERFNRELVKFAH